MRKLSEISVCGKMVIVRELTVAQVSRQFVDLDKQDVPTTLDWLFAEKYMPESTLAEIIERPVTDLLNDDVAPSDLEPLYKEAIKVNPFLGAALCQMREISELMRGMALAGKTGVEETPMTSAGSAMPPST